MFQTGISRKGIFTAVQNNAQKEIRTQRLDTNFLKAII